MNGKKKTAREKAADILDTRHERLQAWVDGWKNHIEDAKDAHKRILTGKQSTGEVLSEFTALTVSCLDTAFGWMRSPKK
jgi:hypothetical protein